VPPGSAQFAALESAQDKVMSNLDAPFHPWPYVEGMTLDEACNDLALISTRVCGDKLPVRIGRNIHAGVASNLPWRS
jgi:sulfoxide reductase catalytic subunit YedY